MKIEIPVCDCCITPIFDREQTVKVVEENNDEFNRRKNYIKNYTVCFPCSTKPFNELGRELFQLHRGIEGKTRLSKLHRDVTKLVKDNYDNETRKS